MSEGKVQTQPSRYFGSPWSKFAGKKCTRGVDSDMMNVTVPSTSTITVNEKTNYTVMNRAVTSACTGDNELSYTNESAFFLSQYFSAYNIR